MDKGLHKARKLGKASGIKLAPLGHHKTREQRQDEARERARVFMLETGRGLSWVDSPAFEEGRQKRRERDAIRDMAEMDREYANRVRSAS